MAEATSRSTLHALLGVPDDVTGDDLRLAYDRAMAMAVRMGDNRRALALSQAFDALPGGVRQRVYPAVQHRRASVDTLERRPVRRPRGGSGGGRFGGGRSSGRPGRRVRGRGRLSRIRRRTVVIVVLMALAVPAGVTVALHWDQWLKRPGEDPAPRPRTSAVVVQQPAGDGSPSTIAPTGSPQVPEAQTESPQVPEAQTESPQVPEAQTESPQVPGVQTESPPVNARRVPLTSVVDANGFVTIECAATRRGASSVRFARPGDVVSCADGAVPRILADR